MTFPSTTFRSVLEQLIDDEQGGCRQDIRWGRGRNGASEAVNACRVHLQGLVPQIPPVQLFPNPRCSHGKERQSHRVGLILGGGEDCPQPGEGTWLPWGGKTLAKKVGDQRVVGPRLRLQWCGYRCDSYYGLTGGSCQLFRSAKRAGRLVEEDAGILIALTGDAGFSTLPATWLLFITLQNTNHQPKQGLRYRLAGGRFNIQKLSFGQDAKESETKIASPQPS